jgi:hypothetical protein
MSDDSENFFKVGQPYNVDCMVQEYRWGRRTLLLRLKRHNSPEVQYIKFSGVEYFAGPMEWTSANFGVRSDEECLALLRDAGRANELFTLEHLTANKYQLFTVQLDHTLIAIVSKGVTRYSG